MLTHIMEDFDAYKLPMNYIFFKMGLEQEQLKYHFIDRSKDKRLKNLNLNDFKKEIELTADEKFSEEGLNLVRKTYSFMTEDYIDFLRDLRLTPEQVTNIEQTDTLHFNCYGSFWETKLMAMISELYNRQCKKEFHMEDFIERTKNNINFFEKYKINFIEMSTRRRPHLDVQYKSVELYSQSECFIGTSNVYLAQELNVPLKGTLAHEFIMLFAALYGYKNANKKAAENWLKYTKGQFPIFLTDTYTTDSFLETVSLDIIKQGKMFRQDSGSPFRYTDNIINYLNNNNLNIEDYTIVYSDGLNPEKALKIKQYADNKGIKCVFGIGTELTRMKDIDPMNMVIKLWSLILGNYEYLTCKLSDEFGKTSGAQSAVKSAQKELNIN